MFKAISQRLIVAACVLFPGFAVAQGLTGALIGTVRDAQGGVLPGARVRVSSPALIGGAMSLTTDEKGQLRFSTLPPGPSRWLKRDLPHRLEERTGLRVIHVVGSAEPVSAGG